MSNSTIKHRLFSAFAALTVSMSLAICVTSLSAQKLEPVLDSNTFETISVEIKKIYNLTEVARKIEDFEGIVGRCEKLLKTENFGKRPRILGIACGMVQKPHRATTFKEC